MNGHLKRVLILLLIFTFVFQMAGVTSLSRVQAYADTETEEALAVSDADEAEEMTTEEIDTESPGEIETDGENPPDAAEEPAEPETVPEETAEVPEEKAAEETVTVEDPTVLAEAKAPALKAAGTKAVDTKSEASNGVTVLAFSSDVHNGGKNGGDNSAAIRLGNWIDIVKSKEGDIDVMAFGGDMARMMNNDPSGFWDYAQSGMDQLTQKGVDGVYTTGNHEYSYGGNFSLSSYNSGAYASNTTQGQYTVNDEAAEGNNYRIYCLGSESGSQSYTNQISSLTAYLNRVGNDKPIFIITHFPLHALSGRNISGAASLIEVLNNAVTENGQMIIFLWGHNHSVSDSYYDQIYGPGTTLSTDNGSKTIQFYYGAAGCMSDNEYSSGSRYVQGKGLVVTITPNRGNATMEFTYYNEAGSDVTEDASIRSVDVTVPKAADTVSGYVITIGDMALTANPAGDDNRLINNDGAYIYTGLAGVSYTAGTTEVTTDMLWQINPSENGYTIQSMDGKYLSATYAANGASTSNPTRGDLSLSETADIWTLDGSFEAWSGDGTKINSTNSGKTLTYYSKTPETGSNQTDINLFTVGSSRTDRAQTSKITEAEITGETTPVTGVTLDKTEETVEVGKTVKLTATVEPSNATNKKVNWSSSNEAIATVSNGTVTGVAEGTATITAKPADDESITATCEVTVTASTTPRYELATSLEDGGEYLIVNANSGSAYALKNPGGTSGGVSIANTDYKTSVTIQSGNYIETDDTDIIWTASANGSGFNITNNGDYIEGYRSSYSGNSVRSFNPQKYPSQYWTYSSDNYLQHNGGDNTYTLRYSSSSNYFTCATSTSDTYKIYLFKKVTSTAPVDVTGVELDKETATLKVGKTTTLTATVTPSNATNKNVTWSSSNSAVATVDSAGKVTGVAAGTATITATTEDGGFTDTCAITVIESHIEKYVLVNELEANSEYVIMSANSGTGYALKNNGASSEGTDMGASSALTITKGDIDNNGSEDTYIENDSDDIVWTTGNEVSIHTDSYGDFGVGFDLSNTSPGGYLEGKSGEVKIYSELQYTTTTDRRGWKYNKDQQLQHVGGRNTYTVYYSNGFTTTYDTNTNKVYLFKKYVPGTDPVSGVTVSPTTLGLGKGSSATLTATVQPSSAANKNVSWSTSDANIATVDNTGKVTGVAEGTATITVTTEDGGKTATCSVTVTAPVVRPGYVIVIGDYALSTEAETDYHPETSSGSTNKYYGLKGVEYDEANIPDNVLWTLTPVEGKENTYYIQSMDGKYLNATYKASSPYEGHLNLDDTQDEWVLDGSFEDWIVSGCYLSSTNATNARTDGRKMNLAFEETGSSNNTINIFTVRSDTNADESSLTSPDITAEVRYEETNVLADGKEYIIAVTKDDNHVYAIKNNSNSIESATLEYVPVSEDADYIITDDSGVAWKYTSSSKYLSNNSRYLQRSTSGLSTSSSSGYLAVYDASNQALTLQRSSTSTLYSVTCNNGTFGSSSSSAAAVRLFEKKSSVTYSIKWVGAGGTVLKIDNLSKGQMPEYTGDTPTKVADDQYTYNFIGWSPEITAVTGLAVYTAQFEAVPKDTHTHTYGEPTWTWAEDHTSATAKFTCTECDDTQTVTDNAPAEKVVTAAGCETDKVVKYTATVTFEEKTYTDTTDNVTVEGTATGHDYGDATYEWAADNSSVTGTRVCSNDATHTITEIVNTTSEITKAATCEGKGETTYTAAFTKEGFTTQTKTVENIDALGHDYGNATYEWADNNASVTGTRVCSHDATHTITETVNTTSEITKPATCEGKGETTYTATFTKEGFATQTKTVENINALGHDYGAPVWDWYGVTAATATFICGNDPTHQVTENAIITNAQGTGEKEGYTVYTATVTFNEETYSDTKDVINQYTLTFKNGDEVVATITEDYGTTITAPAAPTKAFYTFNSWTPAVPETMPAENKTFTATWTEKEAYYLIGSMTEWKVVEANEFVANPDNPAEYSVAATLAANDEIKVARAVAGVAVSADYYPSTEHLGYNDMTGNYTVDQYHAGGVTVYFRPAGNFDDQGWQDFGGYFYIEGDHAITVETNPANAGTATVVRGDGSGAALSAPKGMALTVNSAPADNYQLDKIEIWRTNGGTAAEQTLEGNTFNMPDYDVTVKVYFKAINWTFNNFTWEKTADGYSAVANYTGDNGSTKTVAATVTSRITTAATCEGEGQIVYTATVTAADSLDGTAQSEDKPVTIPATGHEYGNLIPEVAATCTKDGMKAHYECSVCHKLFDTNKVETTAESLKITATGHDWEFVNFTWTGSNEAGYTAAAANYRCKNDSEHTKAIDLTVSSETTPATCETAGSTVYTATIAVADSPDGIAHTDTRTVVLPAFEHDWEFVDFTWTGSDDAGYTAAVANYECKNNGEHTQTVNATVTPVTTDPTCEAAGSTVYTAAVTATDSLDKTEHSDNKTVTNPATGHKWIKPAAWTWTGDDENGYTKVGGTFTCENDPEHVQLVETTDITAVKVDPTPTGAGSITYTAELTGPDNKVYEIEKTIIIPAAGYTYKDPVYTWTKTADGYSVEALKECNEDDTQNITETVTASYAVTTAANCEATGVGTYTAVFTKNAFTTQTKTVTIPAIGHTPVTDAAVAPTCMETGLTEGSHCSVCNEVLVAQETVPALGHDWKQTTSQWNVDHTSVVLAFVCNRDASHTKTVTASGTAITSEITTEPTATEPGVKTYTATVTLDGKTYTVTDTEAIPATGTSVSGSITSFVGNTEEGQVTVQLFVGDSTEAAYTATVDNNETYTFAGVAAGTYNLTVSKKDHATRTYEITVAGAAVTQDVKIHLLGDINGDGDVTTVDAARVNSHAKGKTLLTGYEFSCGDINGDGDITTVDAARTNAHAKGKSLIWE